MKYTKAQQRHIERLQTENVVWKHSEINAVIKQLNLGAKYFREYFEYPRHWERRLTEEQNAFWIEYLNSRFFKKNGERRKNAPGEGVLQVVREFNGFRWVGVKCVHESIGRRIFTPVYRCYDIHGNYFDYVWPHWGECEVLRLKCAPVEVNTGLRWPTLIRGAL